MGPGAVAVNGPLKEVVEASRRARSLSEWFAVTLDAIERELGFEHTSLLVVLRSAGTTPSRAFAGLVHGWSADVLGQYNQRWAESDPLAGELATQMFDAHGFASTGALYPRLDQAQRRFVDQFLASFGVTDQLSFRLRGSATTDGYLTIHASRRLDEMDRIELDGLIRPLARKLRSFLPRGLAATLPLRERQAVELVALGLSNREIAVAMNVSEDTIKKHLLRAMRRLGIARRTQLAVSWATGRRLDIAVPAPPP